MMMRMLVIIKILSITKRKDSFSLNRNPNTQLKSEENNIFLIEMDEG